MRSRPQSFPLDQTSVVQGIALKFVADGGLYGLPLRPQHVDDALRLVRILTPRATWAGLEELVRQLEWTTEKPTELGW